MDLAGSDEIQSAHLAEALQYRPKLMMGCVKPKQLIVILWVEVFHLGSLPSLLGSLTAATGATSAANSSIV